MCVQAVEHDDAALSDLSVAVHYAKKGKYDCLRYNSWSLNSSVVAHNLIKAVSECLQFQVNFVQLRYWWNWKTALRNIKVSVTVCNSGSPE